MSAGDSPATGMAARFERLKAWAVSAYDYCSGGVWQDTRDKWWVRLVKVSNLTVRGFLDADLQSRACAMTYRTVLAIVPMLALLFAVGRGFNLQDYLIQELYSYLPSQRRLLEVAFNFVNSYLEQASEGIFVGIGILFLLWTLVGLLSNVEDVFNAIFDVRVGRSWWRKLSDYTAILLILPVLMICGSGITIFMQTALHKLFDFGFMTPLFNRLMDCAGYVLSWLFFGGSFLLIPNTKVKPLNALVAGIVAGTAFQVLQWLFLSGQLYVTKYNAIYGSFSMLPLMLIWLQLVWLITFICAGICYSSQNIFRYSFESQVKCISLTYRLKVEVAVLALIVKRFQASEPPLSAADITRDYSIPPRLTDEAVTRLIKAGLVAYTPRPGHEESAPGEDTPLQPTHNIDRYCLGEVLETLAREGSAGFIPDFTRRFTAVDTAFDRLAGALPADIAATPLETLAPPAPATVAQ